MFEFFRGYWNDFVSSDGGLALVMLDGLLLIPLALAAFFYPGPTLIAIGVVGILTVAAYEAYVLWRRRHPRHIGA